MGDIEAVASESLIWKPDWHRAMERLTAWWQGKGPAVCLLAPRENPIEAIAIPNEPTDVTARWIDPQYRRTHAEDEMARTLFAAEAFPYFDTEIGPGSLGVLLGCKPDFQRDTVWYEPCLQNPESSGPIRLDHVNNTWWDIHLALIDEGLRHADGRYLVGIPDLIENIDTLAAMRGTEVFLFDLIERPAWVHNRLAEVTEAYTTAFDLMHAKVRGEQGGNAFSAFHLWGPGKTAKVQCDLSCMISPPMFREFVAPYLFEQCKHLDYAMYHLDGPDAIKHLDSVLQIDNIQAIEYTPGAGKPRGGDPIWYDLYRHIKTGGKCVQAVGVKPDQVIPIFDSIGPEGVFLWVNAATEHEAHELLKAIEPYYK